jgi:hypothetical protein
MTDLCEKITVGAVFYPGGMRPAWFVWRGRKYTVSEVTYTWESREGMAKLRHFSVCAGPNVYAMAYDPEGCAWEMRGVEQDWRG